MDHYGNPRGRGLQNPTEYINVHLKNPSCGDDLTLQLKKDNNGICDIRHEAEGCSICLSSASMMAELLQGKEFAEAVKIMTEFQKMVTGEDFDEELLGDAVSLQGVSKLPQRVKCATLAWQACKRAIDAESRDDISAGGKNE